MDSMGPLDHPHVYLQSVPCNFLLGNYIFSVDDFGTVDLETLDEYCPSLIVHVNVDTQLTLPCPYASGCLDHHEYTRYLLDILTNWFSLLGFPRACVELLADEIVCFIFSHRSTHRCISSHRHGSRVIMSVPQISITHVSLVMERFYEEEIPRVKRATNESIDALETVQRTDLEDDDSCVVCLENLDVKITEKIVRMRCNHVFHKDCIVEWLKNSHVCPLCRFEMPAMESLDTTDTDQLTTCI